MVNGWAVGCSGKSKLGLQVFQFPKDPERRNAWIVKVGRDYSLYSGSTNEGSVGRAHHDLDRCARILNEVLDNGPGIIDGVKKRKSLSSPKKDGTTIQCKKFRQTNKLISSDKTNVASKVSSSTPFQTPLSQTRRKRTSSASSLYSCSKSHSHLRPRSLSEQRSCSVPSSRRERSRMRSSSTQGRMTRSIQVNNSASSVLANNSLTSSEADTLTGVHLDNSSQFGVPPVFNNRGQKGQRSSKRRSGYTISATRRHNMEWLKPHTSTSTQTGTKGKENQTELQEKLQFKKRDKHVIANKCGSSSKSDYVRIPSVDQPSISPERELSSPLLDAKISSLIATKSSNQQNKENDVDDLLERTLEGEDVLTQVGVERCKSRSESQPVAGLLGRLRSAALTSDFSLFDSEMEKVSTILNEMLESSSRSRTNVDKLLLPFQREAKELRQEVIELKRQLPEDKDGRPLHRQESDNSIARDLTVKVVAAETRNTQLSNQLTDLAADLANERSKVLQLTQNKYATASGDNQHLRLDLDPPSQQGSEKENSPKLNSNNHRLVALQTTTRLLHTRLSDVASRCDTKTSRELNSILELCARGLIQSMDSDDIAHVQMNRNNNSKWANKPSNLAEVVSSNLSKTRAAGSGCEGVRGSPSRQYRDYKAAGDCSHPLKPPAAYTDAATRVDVPTFNPGYFERGRNLGRDYQAPSNQAAVASDVYASSVDAMNQHRTTMELDLNEHSRSIPHSSVEKYQDATEEEFLHSTFKSSDSTLAEQDVSSLSVSSVSLGTTLADNAFQEGLAQLDANIAKLQASLKSSRFNSST